MFLAAACLLMAVASSVVLLTETLYVLDSDLRTVLRFSCFVRLLLYTPVLERDLFGRLF
jgi:hypothetical protein